MPVSPESVLFVREMVKKRSALALDGTKEYLIETRLAKLADEQGCSSIDVLVARARAGEQALHVKIVEALVTHETSFFRDQHPFHLLQTELLPRLIAARQAQRRLTIWSAACSSGQESYSLAMLIRTHFPELATWTVRILGTDISEPVVAKARAGRFTQLEVNRGLPVQMLLANFDREGAHYVIKDELRRMCEFQQLNLIDKLPSIQADIVVLRNVLIYFDVEAKRSILENVKRVLAPDGALLLGAAETTLNVHAGWEPVMVGPSTYYRTKR